MDRIILVGAGRTSGFLVGRLTQIAPTTVLDISASGLESIAVAPPAPAAGTPLPGLPYAVETRLGDGTSRLVLEDLRGDPNDKVACVVATGSDRVNLEVCRLAAGLGFKPIIAIANDPETAAQCEDLGARGVCKPQLIAQVVEQTMQSGGVSMATTVGFGRGEILEFRVLPSSPAIGVALSALRPDGWRVAAVYRGPELVLPTGKTALQAEDRVLIIGDPAIIRHVAESLRVGLPTFPLLHGPNVVVFLPAGRDEKVENEAEVLTAKTRASALVRMFPEATPARKQIDNEAKQRASTDDASKASRDAPLVGATLPEQVASLQAKQAGVVVTRAAPRRFVDVLLGRGGRDAVLCNQLGVPVLFPRGAGHYERVVYGIAEGTGDRSSADVALDLARMFQVPFCMMRVQLPKYLGFGEPATDALIEATEHRATLHGMSAEVQKLEGNPLAEWLRATRPTDLFVLSRIAGQRDSFTSPDLALRLARSAPCSVLVCTLTTP